MPKPNEFKRKGHVRGREHTKAETLRMPKPNAVKRKGPVRGREHTRAKTLLCLSKVWGTEHHTTSVVTPMFMTGNGL